MALTLRGNLCIRICCALQRTRLGASDATNSKTSFDEMIRTFLAHVSTLLSCPRPRRRPILGNHLGDVNLSQATEEISLASDIAFRDRGNSWSVVTPTSFGKTYISFSAMKKVLEESNSVLVYVTPTKVLINQTAPRINAHYSKSHYGKTGKSVYGVYTGGYHINNPTGCQILVTVPHMLQIILLSPENTSDPNAWPRRIRRAILRLTVLDSPRMMSFGNS